MKQIKYNYPVASSKLVAEDYFGTKSTDHYHNLENPAMQTWFKAQGGYAEHILENSPFHIINF